MLVSSLVEDTVHDYAHIPPPPPAPSPYFAPPVATPVGPSRRRGWVVGAGAFAVVALVFGVLALTRGGSHSPSSALAAAAARTEAQTSARVEMTMVLPLAGITAPLTVSGEVDFTSGASRFVIDLSGLVGASKGQLAPDQTRVELVTKGLVSYMKIPGLDALTGASGKWIKLDSAALAKGRSGVDLENLFAQQRNDPSQMLDLLRTHAQSVTEVGRDNVRGVATTRSTAKIDIAQLYRARAVVVDETRLAAAVEQFSGGVMTVDVWIDDAGLVRRQAIAVPSAAGVLTYNIEFFDFGAPVHVTVPADRDAIDLTALIGTR